MLPIPARIFPVPAHAPDSPSASQPEDPIDIFSLSLTSGTLFPDYAITSHGEPGGKIGYTSQTFGDIILDIPKHPDEEGGRGLFAHYLWSAAAIAAAGIEQGSSVVQGSDDVRKGVWWNVKGCNVLEVGAGTALPSITAALSGAKSVYITDHSSSPALTTGSIVSNAKRALFTSTVQGDDEGLHSKPRTATQVNILPHNWGQLSSPSAHDLKSSFDKIIVADCMWLGSQHDNLITSIIHFLKPLPQDVDTPASLSLDTNSLSPPCALVIAGYHTGRSIVSSFFTKATSRGLTINSIWEIDVGTAASTDEDFESYARSQHTDINPNPSHLGDISQDGIPGFRREWKPVREGENKEMAKKWVVVAVVTKPAGEGGALLVDDLHRRGQEEPQEESVWDKPLRELNERASARGGVVDEEGQESNKEKKQQQQGGIEIEGYTGQIVVDDVGWI